SNCLLYLLLHYINSLCSCSTATPPTAIYSLSLHDALPICGDERPTGDGGGRRGRPRRSAAARGRVDLQDRAQAQTDRRRLEHARSEEHTSELRHQIISYAVFCLKKKNKIQHDNKNEMQTTT